MAERRMFAKTIIDSDAFLDLPPAAQLLYFHLAMRADDDGFVNKPKSVLRLTGCGEEDLARLAQEKFLIPFDSGVVVIKHWKIHNYIRNDRYRETVYRNELAQLAENGDGVYNIQGDGIPVDNQSVDRWYTQDRLGKDRIGQDRLGEKSEDAPRRFTPPNADEVQRYCQERNNTVDAQRFVSYYESNGWMVGKNKMKDWKAAVRSWERKENTRSGSNVFLEMAGAT